MPKVAGEHFDYTPEGVNEAKQKSKKMRSIPTGGFVGSGSRQRGLSGAEKAYETGYAGILGDISSMQGASMDDLFEIISSWNEVGANT